MTTTAGDTIWFDNMLMEVLLPASDTGGTISILEQTHVRGYGTPVHRHDREDQTVYVLAGAITAWLDDDERTVRAGELIHLPRGRAHAFRVDEDGTRLLEINTPGGFEEFHAEAGEPAAGRRLPDPRPPDLATMVAIASTYDCEILGPPPT
jgi:quercetin dioxygenase-like cupin family protein